MAIKELDTCGEERGERRAPLAYELNWLNNEIHLLDHRKGEAEKEFARVMGAAYGTDERTCEVEQLRKAAEEVRELEELHDEYVDRIGVLRDRVVAEMDRLIEQEGIGEDSDSMR